MALSCPICEVTVPPGAPFCLSCGSAVTPVTSPVDTSAEPAEAPRVPERLAPTAQMPHPTLAPQTPPPVQRPAEPTRVLAQGEARRRLVGVVASFDFDPSGQLWPLRLGRTGIGRDPQDNLIHLDRDPTLSRRHAQLIAREGGIWAQDKGSEHGTRVNGRDIGMDAVKLCDGDRVQVGGYTLVLRLL